ncbi:glycosyltransferase [Olleya sp. HaHaR_3_96]|uniref:glycosyltransferase n=1 Tax=Olleya sp. HaHaR_3_96 TaxID=2745560 RepID=UPI001C4EA7CF|nr:glycosyltransferase [Olleya sp. HaHaR_3_96]QXP59911.1 glycosyltransferase family 1 protein [Olleya sp. HaHaR_3_96]
MNILLVGEYSRLHNSLKEGLEALNHKVVIIGSGDGFKSFPVDYKVYSVFRENKALLLLSKAILKVFRVNIIKIELAIKYYFVFNKLKQFDVIQLINEASLKTTPRLEIALLKKLFKKTKKVVLLSCGEDYYSVSHALKNKKKYSILTPYLNDNSLLKEYAFTLEYVTKRHQKLHTFLLNNYNGVIASDLDYHLPLINYSKYLGIIPNPINTDLISYKPLDCDTKIQIFLGINTQNAIKKGIVFFEKALERISLKYPNKVDITITKDLPYKTYINSYNKAHIILDQVYALDQGYNALEAMSKGKVVFTGAEKEWLDYYNVKEDNIVINALPDVDYLVKKLEWLINNPKTIKTISSNAQAFVTANHNHIKIAEQYIATWEKL